MIKDRAEGDIPVQTVKVKYVNLGWIVQKSEIPHLRLLFPLDPLTSKSQKHGKPALYLTYKNDPQRLSRTDFFRRKRL